jgi:hypothetical protein
VAAGIIDRLVDRTSHSATDRAVPVFGVSKEEKQTPQIHADQGVQKVVALLPEEIQKETKVRKPGRPKKTDAGEEMTKISFRIDGETLAALKRLETRDGSPDIRGRRSTVLRRLILDADKLAS